MSLGGATCIGHKDGRGPRILRFEVWAGNVGLTLFFLVHVGC